MRILIIIFAAALGLSSCFDKGDCLINNSNLIKINLKKKADNKDTTLTFSAVQVEGATAFLYQNVAKKALELPVDGAKTTTSFILSYGGVEQKITFDYINQTIIPSADCGAFVYQKK